MRFQGAVEAEVAVPRLPFDRGNPVALEPGGRFAVDVEVDRSIDVLDQVMA